MSEKTSKELSDPVEDDRQSSMMPACCGTGCTVCVMDYWEPEESHSDVSDIGDQVQLTASDDPDQVQVLDPVDLKLLEAIERALQEADEKSA